MMIADPCVSTRVDQDLLFLKTTIWLTRGSRFNAARRLNDRVSRLRSLHAVVAGSLVVAGVYVSWASNIGGLEASALLAGIVISVSSMLQLATSATSDAFEDRDAARALHESGQKLSGLLDRLRALRSSGLAADEMRTELEAIRHAYRAIESDSLHNHQPRDYRKMMADNALPDNWGSLDLEKVDSGSHRPKRSPVVRAANWAHWYFATALTFVTMAALPIGVVILVRQALLAQ